MIKTPLSTMIGGAFWTPESTILGGTSKIFDQLIKSLFANNEQGFAYDPNDLSTMFQDAAGTVPVTGAGQPVGLILDKSGRNNHARQTDSAMRPILRQNVVTGAYYLEFDGSDDFLRTSNIDFTSTNKVSLFTGVRKLSDAATAMLCELDITSNQAFSISAPAGNGAYKFSVRNTSLGVGAHTTSSLYSAPKSVVLSANIDSVSFIKMRLNATSVEVSTEVSGLNMANAPLYIGRRGGISIPFNGHLYSLIGVGRLTTDSEVASIEKELAKRTGVTLSV